MNKKLLLLISVSLLVFSSAYAEDTEIPNVSLTLNQKKNLIGFLNPAPFKGFAFHPNGRCVGVSLTTPTALEIQNAATALNSIPETLSQSYYASYFSSKSLFKDMKDNWSKTAISEFSSQITVILNYADQKDFSGMKAYLNQLLADGIINQAKWNAVNNLMKIQGIDLLLH